MTLTKKEMGKFRKMISSASNNQLEWMNQTIEQEIMDKNKYLKILTFIPWILGAIAIGLAIYGMITTVMR